MRESHPPFATHVFVCQATREDGKPACGNRWDAGRAADELKSALKSAGVSARVSRSGCLGPCAEGPNVMLYPGKVWFQGCSLEDVPAIVDRVVSGNGMFRECPGS